MSEPPPRIPLAPDTPTPEGTTDAHCPECGMDMRGMGIVGACPGCGAPFELVRRPPPPPPGPPRCVGCGYSFDGLGERGHCPECGWPFDLSDLRSFTTLPRYDRWRYWAPGLAMAVVASVGLQLVLTLGLGNWGAAAWVSVPFAGGCLLGYGSRPGCLLTLLLPFVVVASIVLGVMLGGIGGAFCGLMLAAIAFTPVLVGVAFGVLLREFLKSTSYSQRAHLPVIFAIVSLPVLHALAEGPASPGPAVRVSTSAVVGAPIGDCWEALHFYEEVKHEPPWILRVGLARPVRTLGSSRAVGDVKACIYNRGRITKRITEVDAPNLLAFRVVEQEIGYERDVLLTGGSFRLEALSPTATRITLTTEYRPLIGPRWAWGPAERLAVSTLHAHVLEGIAREVGGERGARSGAVAARDAGER